MTRAERRAKSKFGEWVNQVLNRVSRKEKETLHDYFVNRRQSKETEIAIRKLEEKVQKEFKYLTEIMRR